MGESKRRQQQNRAGERPGFGAIKAPAREVPEGQPIEEGDQIEVQDAETAIEAANQAEDAAADGSDLTKIGERASRIIRPNAEEMPAVEKPVITMRDARNATDPARSCAACFHFRTPARHLPGGLCTEKPPMAVVMGLSKNIAGETTMNTEAVFPPVRATWGCGQWRPMESQ